MFLNDPLPDHIQLKYGDPGLNIRTIDYCNERFFVADLYSKSIKSFTRDGEYLKSYANSGQGPGDFDAQAGPLNISCLNSGDIVVTDSRNRLLFFDNDLNHIETTIVQGGKNSLNLLLQRLILETDSHLYYEANLVLLEPAERNSVVVINKESYVVEEVIGAPVFTTHRFLRRHATIFDSYSEYFVTFSRFTGLVRPFKYKSDEYFSFNVQDEMSFEFFEENLPEIPRSMSDFEATGLSEGFVINSLVSYNGNIYLIQERFASEPSQYIDIYDYQGNHIDKFPNKHEIIALVVLDGAIYGFNADDNQLFLIKRS